VDAAVDEGDWMPGFLDGALQVASALRHPRSLLRAAFSGA
jgi:hypothetical protein